MWRPVCRRCPRAKKPPQLKELDTPSWRAARSNNSFPVVMRRGVKPLCAGFLMFRSIFGPLCETDPVLMSLKDGYHRPNQLVFKAPVKEKKSVVVNGIDLLENVPPRTENEVRGEQELGVALHQESLELWRRRETHTVLFSQVLLCCVFILRFFSPQHAWIHWMIQLVYCITTSSWTTPEKSITNRQSYGS